MDQILVALKDYRWTVSGVTKICISVSIFVTLVFGFEYLVGAIAAVLAFFLGASYRLHQKSVGESKEDADKRRVQVLRRIIQNATNSATRKESFAKGDSPNHSSSAHSASESSGKNGGRKSINSTFVKSPRSKMDMRLTGSAIIDETLHEMIDYIMRDYVHSWFDHISEDDEFIHELRKTMQESLVNLSSRVKEIDWIPFLTTQLVDDAASHLRIYRTALTKTKENPNSDLISVFFDIEAAMEKNLCRDMVCTDDTHLQDYLQGISETLLYLLLPQDTYSCTPVGALGQDLLVNYVFVPLLQLLSDPDFVNQHIIWLCQTFPITSDILLTVIRMCDNMDEISAVSYFFDQQISDTRDAIDRHRQQSPDQAAFRIQLKSLNVMNKLIKQRLSQLKEGKQTDWTDDGDQWQNYFMTPGMKLHSLSLEEVIKNSVALSYFIDYLNSVNGNHYILMYLNADAWKASAEQQLGAIAESTNKGIKLTIDQKENNQAMLDCMRDAAINIHDQYLAEKAVPRVKLPENVVRRFYIQVRTEPTISTTLFDDVQESLIELMKTTEKFYPSFLRHKLYVKCLMELDLLKAESVNTTVSDDEEEEDGVIVEEYEEIAESMSRQSNCSSGSSTDMDGPPRDDFQMCRDCIKQHYKLKSSSLASSAEELNWEKNLWSKKYKLNAEIIEAGLASEKGKQYGVYAVQVSRWDENDKKEKKWHIYRRYSDFYDFHQWIKSKWAMLNRIEFPGKHTFRTTDRMFLEKRMVGLNKYLCSVLTMTVEPCFGESLQDSLLHFLEPGNYVIKKKHFSEKIDTLVNPLKQSVRSVTDVVKSVPDTVISTVDGFAKIFQSKPVSAGFIEANKVGASIDEADDNIPLRIILLLMDEVFDLKSRNQWLRRRIVAIIRQVLKAMLGDTINRRIVDYVAYLTSPERVSGYLRNLQKTLWPGGCRISSRPSRDSETKMRTRFAAKLSLLASLSDELKHLIGSDTTRRGLLIVFDLCQDRVLNRRFILVLFEGILKTLFPDKPFATVIQRLHYRSNRVGKSRPFLVPSLVLTSASSGGSSTLTRSASSNATSIAGSYVSPRSSRRTKK